MYLCFLFFLVIFAGGLLTNLFKEQVLAFVNILYCLCALIPNFPVLISHFYPSWEDI